MKRTIEDDPDIQATLKETLESEGFLVYVASNGYQAMDVLDHIKDACLILLDLMMPGMNGFDFLKAIKLGSHKFVQIPIIAESGRTETKIPEGAIGLLKKPFDLDKLFRVVKNHCHPNPRERAAG